MFPTIEIATLSYRVPPEERGYCELSIAIVRLAVEDYRRNKRKTFKDANDKGAYGLMIELRTFFLSDEFEALTGVSNPCEFLEKLDSQIEYEYINGIQRKRVKAKHEIK